MIFRRPSRRFDLVADEATRVDLAAVGGLRTLPRLEATLDVGRYGRDGLRVTGIVSATVGQTCVITLEPIEREIEELVDLVFAPRSDEEPPRSEELRDAPEPLIDGTLDLGALATEFLVLAIDPYPRKPERSSSAAAADEGTRPFAALAALKKGRAGPTSDPAPCIHSPVVSGRRPAIVAAGRPRRTGLAAPAPWPPDQFMPHKVRIALDAMGGDHGPSVVVPGAELSLLRHPDSEFLLFGDRALVEPLLACFRGWRRASRLVHTDVAVKMDDKPSQALRHGRWKSSMWLAIDAVKKGEADVAVSAGNTGALMAMAKFNLKTMAGIERPAIAALWPTLRGESVVLDVGASIGADAQHLVDLAAMGSAMARVLFDLERPTVGLLNIGVEEVKGLEEVREAGQILRERQLPASRLCRLRRRRRHRQGTVDVVVTEGFAGNIALKTAEGTARQIAEYLQSAMSRTWRAKLGYLLARQAFRTLARQDGSAQGPMAVSFSGSMAS